MNNKYIKLILRAIIYLVTNSLVQVALVRIGIPSNMVDWTGLIFAAIYFGELFYPQTL